MPAYSLGGKRSVLAKSRSSVTSPRRSCRHTSINGRSGEPTSRCSKTVATSCPASRNQFADFRPRFSSSLSFKEPSQPASSRIFRATFPHHRQYTRGCRRLQDRGSRQEVPCERHHLKAGRVSAKPKFDGRARTACRSRRLDQSLFERAVRRASLRFIDGRLFDSSHRPRLLYRAIKRSPVADSNSR